MNAPAAFDHHAYCGFLEFWNEHDQDLAEGVSGADRSTSPPLGLMDGPRLINPTRTHALVADLIGADDAARLFHEREGLLADEAFRCRVGLQLWAVADAAPHNSGQDFTYISRHHPRRADFWQERRTKRDRRLQRYIRRVQALRASQGLDIPLPPEPPATGPYALPPTPANTRSMRTRLNLREYYDLLDFWDHHDRDLAEAIRSVMARCEQAWDPAEPEDVFPRYSLKRLGAFLAKLLGRRAVARLFWRWEEAVADEALRCEAGMRLWEVVDAAPETPETATIFEYRHRPEFAPDAEGLERRRDERRKRYALRERALPAPHDMVAEAPA